MPIETGGHTEDVTQPTLDLFSFDMNIGQLSLTFDEAVQYSSFFIPGWRLEGPSGFIPISYLEGATIEPRDWYILNINLTENNFDVLRIIGYPAGLFRDLNSSFVSAFPRSILDLAENGNARFGISPADPPRLRANDYTPDVTQPTLIAFNFSLERDSISTSDQAYLDLVFSEPVVPSTINFSLIEFHNSYHIDNSTSDGSYVLTGGIPSSSSVLRTVKYVLSLDDTNAIKALENLATNVNNSYLIFREGAIQDVFYLPVSEEDGYTIQATAVVADTTQPELESFTIDMDSGVLVFSFSETVDGVTFDPSLFTLQSDPSPSPMQYYMLMGGMRTLYPSPEITLVLTDDDLNAIKATRGLATELANTYISVENGGVLDMAGLNLTTTVKQASPVFTADTNPPQLLGFILNLTSNQLVLTFNETVSALPSDVMLSKITIHPTDNGTLGGVMLTSTSTVASNDSTVIVIALSSIDLNRLKLNTELATSVNNTYVTLETRAFVDMVDNSILQQTAMADDFEEDLVRPSLTQWSFDLNRGIFCLTFDETVDVSSLNIASLSLLDGDNGTATVMLSITDHDAVTNSTNGTLVKLYLTPEDLNQIKLNESLFTTINSSYLSLQSSFIADMNGQPLNPVDALRASQFTNDTTRPVLMRATLDVVSGLLRLEFSETMNAASFNASGLTFSTVMTYMADNNSFTLTGGEVRNVMDDIVITLAVSPDDLNELKAIMIGVMNITSWLAMEATTVVDQSNRPVLPETAFEVEISNFDNVPPVLLSFVLNYTDETITLTFSETVNGMALNVTDISLLSYPHISTTSYSLSFRSRPASVFDPVIVIYLDTTDVDELKKRLDLATNTSNTFISFSSNLVSDVSGNPVIPRPSASALNASEVVADMKLPFITDFEFDLDSGILTIYLSETILASSVNVTELTLQSTFNLTSETEVYALTGGDVLTPDGPLLRIQLTPDDLNGIKLIPSLVDSPNTTYISFTEDLLTDANSNNIEAVSQNMAEPTGLFTPDTTSPVLRLYTLDLTTEQLIFNFSEAVNISSFDSNGVTLSSGLVYNESTVLPLSGGVISSIDLSVVYFKLTPSDVNIIKRFSDGLGKLDNSTLIRLAHASVFDTSGNPVNGTFGLAVDVIITDSIAPEVNRFDLDMNTGHLTLYFTETVFAIDVEPSEISLQNTGTLTTSSAGYTLSSASLPIQINDTAVLLNLTNNDQNEIKKRPLLAVDNTTTFLTLMSKALNDTSGNPVVSIPVESALSVTSYTMDETLPDLKSFSLDLDSGTLSLKFTETVNATTLVVQKLSFLDAIAGNATTNYTLTGQ